MARHLTQSGIVGAAAIGIVAPNASAALLLEAADQPMPAGTVATEPQPGWSVANPGSLPATGNLSVLGQPRQDSAATLTTGFDPGQFWPPGDLPTPNDGCFIYVCNGHCGYTPPPPPCYGATPELPTTAAGLLAAAAVATKVVIKKTPAKG